MIININLRVQLFTLLICTRLLQLDVRTKLCIRDSLYRLAKSAEQRHHCMDANGGNRQVKGAGSHLETGETDK